jgi:DNA-binding NarL/FixJ family response regulator
MCINVSIVDDHPMVLAGLQQLLGSFENINVSNTYSCGKDLLQGLKDSLPDVLILDIQLPDQNGEELTKIIRKTYPQINILAMTSIDTPILIKNMLKAGCLGYLLKNADRQSLIAAIETVYRGEQFITPAIKELLFQDMLGVRRQANARVVLTRREKEILQLIAIENTSQEIADKLFLSLRTVENHRKNMLQKFDVKNMVGLVKKSMEYGLLE